MISTIQSIQGRKKKNILYYLVTTTEFQNSIIKLHVSVSKLTDACYHSLLVCCFMSDIIQDLLKYKGEHGMNRDRGMVTHSLVLVSWAISREQRGVHPAALPIYFMAR